VPQIGSSQTAVNVSPDLRLLGFTFAVSLVTGVLFGIAPALQCTRPDLVPVLKDEVPGSIGLSRFTLRNALVVIQVALSLLLLIGASLFVRSLSNLREIETGFRRDQTLIVFVDPSRNGYKGQRLRDFYERLRENVERMPGVQSSSLAFITPLSGMRWNGDFVAEGYQWKPGDEKVVDMNAVGPRYFETVGIPILVGRDFRPDDNPPRSLDPPTTLSGGMKPPDLPGRRVAIINESMAKSFFAGRSPIGMRVCMGEEFDAGQAFEIVGVVGDVRYLDLREAFEPMIYLPVWRSTPRSTALCIRTSSDAARILDAVRHQVSALDPAVPMLNSGTLQQQINNNILEDRLITTLSGFFGLLALLLAAVGLYGVISYAVTRRTREIGIRMALGAQRTEVAQLVLRDAALMVATGAAIGIPTSLAATRLVQSFLFGISAQDPLAIGLGAAALAAAAAIACYMPARRATKVDPMVALRYE
jgi:predicted permease